jgi:hypothetical protein
MTLLPGNLRSDLPPGSLFKADTTPCAWTAATLTAEQTFVDLPASVNAEVRAALAEIGANGLTLETVEQEDFRTPSFARLVAAIHQRLDAGPGIAILRGLDLAGLAEGEIDIVAWALSNYVGRPIRQGLQQDRRLFTVTNNRAQHDDPIRIGATTQESRMHTDNGCLEPRAPEYVALLCVNASRSGGESTLVSAASAHRMLREEGGSLLPELFNRFHFLPPRLHTWPAGPKTICKPIFEAVGDELHVHYARVMVEPGMELAGTPLSETQRAALDRLDEVVASPSLVFEYQLQPGEMLINNNLTTLHGRRAYDDAPGQPRKLKRIWMWRRHRGPGDNPVLLDAAEL